MQAQKGVRAAHVGGRVRVSPAYVTGVRRTRPAHVGGKGRVMTAHMGGKGRVMTAHMGGKGAVGAGSKRRREAAVEAARGAAKGQGKITFIGEGLRVAHHIVWEVAVAYVACHSRLLHEAA